MPHAALYLAQAGEKGLAVFTEEDLPTDLLVEEAPVIVMSDQERYHLDHTRLHDYIFEWEPDGRKECCMALGWVALFNHSYTSNCEYFMDYDNNTMQVKTVRAIAAGEELTINYNGDWNDARPVWFDVID